MMILVCCVKWGTKYPAHYVNRLANMVARWMPRPYLFVCFTEDAEGLSPEIITRPFPDAFRGSLNKISLFRSDLFPEGATIVFLDLDIVICGPLDFLLDGSESFKTCRLFSGEQGYNTSVMRIRAGAHAEIYQQFLLDDGGLKARGATQGDQAFIWSAYRGGGLFPPEKIRSFKLGLESRAWGGRKFPILPWMTTRLPEGVAIVAFHGKPDPEDVATRSYGNFKRAPFVQEHWR